MQVFGSRWELSQTFQESLPPFRAQKPSGVWVSLVLNCRKAVHMLIARGLGKRGETGPRWLLQSVSSTVSLGQLRGHTRLSQAPKGELADFRRKASSNSGTDRTAKQPNADTVGGFDPATKDGERVAVILLLLTSIEWRKAVSPIGCP